MESEIGQGSPSFPMDWSNNMSNTGLQDLDYETEYEQQETSINLTMVEIVPLFLIEVISSLKYGGFDYFNEDSEWEENQEVEFEFETIEGLTFWIRMTSPTSYTTLSTSTAFNVVRSRVISGINNRNPPRTPTGGCLLDQLRHSTISPSVTMGGLSGFSRLDDSTEVCRTCGCRRLQA
ncbi:hypothetical protein Tco_0327461 [Tanacetum coccineum]